MRDLWRWNRDAAGRRTGPRLGVRRLFVLLDWLPEGNPVERSYTDTGQAWTVLHDLLATLVEVASVGASARHRFSQPMQVPRPRYAEPESSGPDYAAIAAFFGMTYTPS